MRPARGRAFVAVGIAGVSLAGCGSRTLSITSEPSGALVSLNGDEVGRTPLEVGFRYYGQYDVRLRREGYEPLAANPWAAAPWYEYPPIDVVLLPFPIETRIDWHFELEPAASTGDAPEARDALIERAGELRERTESGG
ncbi:MAG: PEGA domain-containing protein [Planctomycetota bacterium]